MKVANEQQNLDDLAVEAVRLGRQVAERAGHLSLGGGAQDTAFVARCLTRLTERRPFIEADEGGFDSVAAILAADIAGEVLEFEQRFVETKFDAAGQHGEIRKVPVYSERGAELVELQKSFCKFLEARNTVLDHIAAHRALLALMSG